MIDYDIQVNSSPLCAPSKLQHLGLNIYSTFHLLCIDAPLRRSQCYIQISSAKYEHRSKGLLLTLQLARSWDYITKQEGNSEYESKARDPVVTITFYDALSIQGRALRLPMVGHTFS